MARRVSGNTTGHRETAHSATTHSRQLTVSSTHSQDNSQCRQLTARQVTAKTTHSHPSSQRDNSQPHRDRLRVQNIPPNPGTLQDLQLPERYQETKGGDVFLLYDSGPETVDNRIIVFCTASFCLPSTVSSSHNLEIPGWYFCRAGNGGAVCGEGKCRL